MSDIVRASIVFNVENGVALGPLADAIRDGLERIHRERRNGLHAFSVAPSDSAAEIWVSVEVELPTESDRGIEDYVLDLIHRAMNFSGDFTLGESDQRAENATMAAGASEYVFS